MKKLGILFMTTLPLLAGACRLYTGKENPDPEPIIPEQPVKKDTTFYKSEIAVKAPLPVLSLDCLVYRTDGLRDLIDHHRTGGAALSLELPDSLPKMIAVVANARGTFNLKALQHYDSLSGIAVRLEDEDTDAPMMSGIFTITPGRDTTLALTPLLCTIELAGVTSYLEGDVLAENPRVWLENVNSEAELFKEGGFAVRDAAATKPVFLPGDIGLYTQYPEIRLYCYPNDLPDPSAGNPATELVFQCEIRGETRTIRTVLHPIRRGEVILVEEEIR